MSHRFVYTDRDGREVHLVTQADLEEAVASGAIVDETPLFDEDAGELGPAKVHPAYQKALGAVDLGNRPQESETETEPSTSEPDLDLGGLTLAAPAPDDVDDTVEDFKQRLERERRQAKELTPGADHDDLPMVRGDTVADIADPVTASPIVPPPAPEPPTKPGAGPRARSPGGRGDPPARRALGPTPSWPEPDPDDEASVTPSPSEGVGIRQVVILAALVGVGAWGIADARTSDAVADGTSEILILESAQASGPPPPGFLDVRASSEAAFLDMRDGMERIRNSMDVARPPETWLSGVYLSDPGSAPDVRDFWTRYGTFVDSIRSAEEELFRAGFAGRLQQVGITGPVLSIRLARGLTDFRADRPRRNQVYDAMDALADEALAFDSWLRSVEGRIAYAGVRDDAVSMAPGIEAAALDDQTADELSRRLDAILDALDVVSGFDPTQAGDPTGRALGELGGDGSGR